MTTLFFKETPWCFQFKINTNFPKFNKMFLLTQTNLPIFNFLNQNLYISVSEQNKTICWASEFSVIKVILGWYVEVSL